MSGQSIKKRIDQLEDAISQAGRFIIIEGRDRSDEAIAKCLALGNVKPESNDFLVTINRYADDTISQPRLLRVSNLDGSKRHVSKEQRDAAVRVALRADR